MRYCSGKSPIIDICEYLGLCVMLIITWRTNLLNGQANVFSWGYPFGKKEWKVNDIKIDLIFVWWDAKFYQKIFSFSETALKDWTKHIQLIYLDQSLLQWLSPWDATIIPEIPEFMVIELGLTTHNGALEEEQTDKPVQPNSDSPPNGMEVANRGRYLGQRIIAPLGLQKESKKIGPYNISWGQHNVILGCVSLTFPRSPPSAPLHRTPHVHPIPSDWTSMPYKGASINHKSLSPLAWSNARRNLCSWIQWRMDDPRSTAWKKFQ